MDIVGKDAEKLMSWHGLIAALEAGHRLPRAEIADLLLYRKQDTLLDRAAWIDGLGSLVKVGTICPATPVWASLRSMASSLCSMM